MLCEARGRAWSCTAACIALEHWLPCRVGKASSEGHSLYAKCVWQECRAQHVPLGPWDVLLHTPGGEWKDATSNIFWDESAADPSVEIVGAGGSVLSAQICCCFACVAGDEERSAAPQFKSLKALQSHQRVKHGIRSPMRFFASGSGVCPACHTNFRQRLRLLAHLCDSRRPICALT